MSCSRRPVDDVAPYVTSAALSRAKRLQQSLKICLPSRSPVEGWCGLQLNKLRHPERSEGPRSLIQDLRDPSLSLRMRAK